MPMEDGSPSVESVSCSRHKLNNTKISFIVGEMTNASSVLPRVLNDGMKIIITLFLAVNISFYSALTIEEIASSDAIALVQGLI